MGGSTSPRHYSSRRAEELRKEGIGDNVLPVVKFDEAILHQLGLGGIHRGRDTKGIAPSVCISEFARPFAGKGDKLLFP